jgi:predicted DsbA family dithiol-disulfide isomerase
VPKRYSVPQSEEAMRVEVWSDIICPWCGLGLHRLRAALARFDHAADVEIVHHSFQLDERAPAGQTESVRSMLAKKGLADAQIDGVTARVAQLAAAEGLQPYIVLENRVGNTSLAHELAAWATERGRGSEMWDLLFKTYFGEAQSVFEVDALVGLAAKLGLDIDAAREALTSRRYSAQVKADAREAQQLGANGVPFFVIDRQFAVGGAQPAELLLQALNEAWGEKTKARPDPT